MLISRAELAEMIPHAGRMCLLDSVTAWDAASIRCETLSHQDADHPMAEDGILHAVCGLEYGAQAMAIHGRLTGAVGARPRLGYIASVRDLRWSVPRLDALRGPLTVDARKLAGDGAAVMYSFAIAAEGQSVVSGRAAVILEIVSS